MSIASGVLRIVQPLQRLGTWYYKAAERKPFQVAVITSGFKTTAADAMAQIVFEQKEQFDYQRNFMFTVFGFVYLGCVQYAFFNKALVAICGPITNRFGHMATSPIKTFIDQCVHHPLSYFPVFYLWKGYFEGNTVEQSLGFYQDELFDNMLALWKIWVPAQLVNFAFVPRHMRVPYVAGVSFVWTIVLSLLRGNLDKTESVEPALTKVVHQPVPAPSGATQIQLTQAKEPSVSLGGPSQSPSNSVSLPQPVEHMWGCGGSGSSEYNGLSVWQAFVQQRAVVAHRMSSARTMGVLEAAKNA